ncbi:type II toxin-antitoxin system RelE/ParE family toxin [Agrobacterium vitis]|uniref:type II toxin-antitoxin system RelE/ParE family toxin n=1 Tax=Agrobacterium vitis TaxID=373 RepID=UPI00307D30CC
MNYRLHIFEVRKTDVFLKWFKSLRDIRAQARIQIRIDRLELGLLGDAKFFEGIGEMRIDYGPGYRVYFVQRGQEIIILLCGGDKSTQSKDIKLAKDTAKEI